MSKKIKVIDDIKIKSLDNFNYLEDFITYLNELVEEHSEKYSSLMIHRDYDDDYYLEGKRLETDKEYEKRLETDKEYEKRLKKTNKEKLEKQKLKQLTEEKEKLELKRLLKKYP